MDKMAKERPNTDPMYEQTGSGSRGRRRTRGEMRAGRELLERGARLASLCSPNSEMAGLDFLESVQHSFGELRNKDEESGRRG